MLFSHGQNALSHWLNQESLTVLNVIGKSGAGKLPLKCIISQNRLQMKPESYANYHKHLVLLLHLQQLFPDVFSQHSCSVLCHFLSEPCINNLWALFMPAYGVLVLHDFEANSCTIVLCSWLITVSELICIIIFLTDCSQISTLESGEVLSQC